MAGAARSGARGHRRGTQLRAVRGRVRRAGGQHDICDAGQLPGQLEAANRDPAHPLLHRCLGDHSSTRRRDWVRPRHAQKLLGSLPEADLMGLASKHGVPRPGALASRMSACIQPAPPRFPCRADVARERPCGTDHDHRRRRICGHASTGRPLHTERRDSRVPRRRAGRGSAREGATRTRPDSHGAPRRALVRRRLVERASASLGGQRPRHAECRPRRAPSMRRRRGCSSRRRPRSTAVAEDEAPLREDARGRAASRRTAARRPPPSWPVARRDLDIVGRAAIPAHRARPGPDLRNPLLRRADRAHRGRRGAADAQGRRPGRACATTRRALCRRCLRATARRADGAPSVVNVATGSAHASRTPRRA